MAMAWRETDLAGAEGEPQSAAARMWRNACDSLCAPRGDEAWSQIVEASPTDGIWHSLKNCVAYQAELWENLLANGIPDVMQPAAFKMAIVLRHTPADLAVKILNEMLKSHPQCQDLTSYVLALLTDDEASGGGSPPAAPAAPASPPAAPAAPASPPAAPAPPASPPATPLGPAPARDLQLYADCELAALAAPPALYDDYSRLVRAEYPQFSRTSYSELRIKILNQFGRIPKLFNTPEFEGMQEAALENISREIKALREQQ